ncbi:CsbD family protein [Dactylosporangium salmoneum]|uniref:CsbD family protein n=1 Tax=Dactylosporangium salmoneum TaxID=53361 RepID=A0ABN3FB87_9ACTN
MSFEDKVEHKAEELKGEAKEHYGTATGDEELRAEGRADQDAANVKQAGDELKDAAHDVKDALS